MNRKTILTSLALLVSVTMTAPAGAVSWTEVGDAENLPGTAQTISGSGPLTSISGSITSKIDVDMYKIYIHNPAAFSASTMGGANFDTQLYLFDENGYGIYANDDFIYNFTLQSTLPAGHSSSPTGVGDYYLAISSYPNYPGNQLGPIFSEAWGPLDGIYRPTGSGNALPISEWVPTERISEMGDYIITVTGASVPTSVPEPSSMLLLGSGIIGLGLWRKHIAGKKI